MLSLDSARPLWTGLKEEFLSELSSKRNLEMLARISAAYPSESARYFASGYGSRTFSFGPKRFGGGVETVTPRLVRHSIS